MERKELLERMLELETLIEQLEMGGSYLKVYYPVKSMGKGVEHRENSYFNQTKFKDKFVIMVGDELDNLYKQLYNQIKSKYN